jgi:hypothetical protein
MSAGESGGSALGGLGHTALEAVDHIFRICLLLLCTGVFCRLPGQSNSAYLPDHGLPGPSTFR